MTALDSLILQLSGDSDEDHKDITLRAYRARMVRDLLVELQERREADTERFADRLDDDDVEWVVNEMAELGVKIGSRFFFLYKGCSYNGGTKWRRVGKREFGECCHPPGLERLTENYIGHYGEEEGDWQYIPPQPNRSLGPIETRQPFVESDHPFTFTSRRGTEIPFHNVSYYTPGVPLNGDLGSDKREDTITVYVNTGFEPVAFHLSEKETSEFRRKYHKWLEWQNK